MEAVEEAVTEAAETTLLVVVVATGVDSVVAEVEVAEAVVEDHRTFVSSGKSFVNDPTCLSNYSLEISTPM